MKKNPARYKILALLVVISSIALGFITKSVLLENNIIDLIFTIIIFHIAATIFGKTRLDKITTTAVSLSLIRIVGIVFIFVGELLSATAPVTVTPGGSLAIPSAEASAQFFQLLLLFLVTGVQLLWGYILHILAVKEIYGMDMAQSIVFVTILLIVISLGSFSLSRSLGLDGLVLDFFKNY